MNSRPGFLHLGSCWVGGDKSFIFFNGIDLLGEIKSQGIPSGGGKLNLLRIWIRIDKFLVRCHRIEARGNFESSDVPIYNCFICIFLWTCFIVFKKFSVAFYGIYSGCICKGLLANGICDRIKIILVKGYFD